MNDCTFTGRLTADAEQRFTQSGTSVANVTLAVDCGYGEHKRTEFVRLVIFKREGLIPHLLKGKPVMVKCEYQNRPWEDKDGVKRNTPEFIVRDLEFQQGSPRTEAQAQPAREPATAQQEPARKPMDAMDDVPFLVMLAPFLGAMMAAMGVVG